MRTPTDTDVLIIGAGPSGLLLAGDLAAAGVHTTVLERRPAQDDNLTRAFAVHARTLELLDARGIADELIATGTRLEGLRLLGGVSLELTGLPSRFPYLLMTPQYRTEQVLARRAEAAGVSVVRGAAVETVRQDGDGVSVRCADGAEYRGSYAVGTDGVHSTVRQQLELPFPGEAVVQSLILADVRLERRPPDTVAVNSVGDHFAFLAPFGDGWYRVICRDRRRQLPDDALVEFDEVVTAMRAVFGDDYGVHAPRWMSRFHSDERQVPRYRVGRVFLAGDAAHCHSPAGGLGMNTGLQDAANLGWKLGGAVRGDAPDWLLDSYHAERHPVGRDALRFSGALLRGILAPSALPQRLRSTVAGAVLRLGPLRRFATATVSGLGIRYPAPRGSHPMVGRRVPDIALVPGESGVRGTEPTRMYEALRAGRFVVVCPTGTEVPAQWAGRVVTVRPVDDRLPVALVRPDGYVAWAGVNAYRLGEALREWLGS